MSQTELKAFYMQEHSLMALPDGWEIVMATFVNGQWKILCKRTVE